MTTVGGFEAHRELAGGAAERLDQLVVHDLDELLAGRQALRQLGADRALLHALDERAHDADVDVGFEQRDADLARDLVDVASRSGARGCGGR